jgi:MoaA/NifB/PqqE/SkfB family radical SAM enzyme
MGGDRPRRYTLCITLRCNLACAYYYVRKNCATMSLTTAQRALDFIFRHAPP